MQKCRKRWFVLEWTWRQGILERVREMVRELRWPGKRALHVFPLMELRNSIPSPNRINSFLYIFPYPARPLVQVTIVSSLHPATAPSLHHKELTLGFLSRAHFPESSNFSILVNLLILASFTNQVSWEFPKSSCLCSFFLTVPTAIYPFFSGILL